MSHVGALEEDFTGEVLHRPTTMLLGQYGLSETGGHVFRQECVATDWLSLRKELVEGVGVVRQTIRTQMLKLFANFLHRPRQQVRFNYVKAFIPISSLHD
jgi:hypothetical protein